MNNDKLTSEEGAMFGRNQWDVPICVRLLAYVRFTNEMDVQLRRLVACWGYTAAPIARGTLPQSPEGHKNRR